MAWRRSSRELEGDRRSRLPVDLNQWGDYSPATGRRKLELYFKDWSLYPAVARTASITRSWASSSR